jgi:hypothetical protein
MKKVSFEKSRYIFFRRTVQSKKAPKGYSKSLGAFTLDPPGNLPS